MAYLICKVVNFDLANERIEIEPITGDISTIQTFIQNGGVVKSTFIESSNITLDTTAQTGEEANASSEIRFNYRKSY